MDKTHKDFQNFSYHDLRNDEASRAKVYANL